MDNQQKVNWLNTHWVGGKTCPICSHNSWEISENDYVMVKTNENGDFQLGGPVYPCYLVVCTHCGYTMQFNSIIANAKQTEKDKVSFNAK